jgi:serine protease AprX
MARRAGGPGFAEGITNQDAGTAVYLQSGRCLDLRMPRSVLVLGVLLSCLTPAIPAAADDRISAAKLDVALRQRAETGHGFARVIIRATSVDAVEPLVARVGGRTGRHLTGINGIVAEVPAGSLRDLASAPGVLRISLDRRVEGSLERTGAAIGARWVAENLGVDGAGIGVAIIDSGVTRHDDLAGNRIVQFVDFVDYQTQPHDGYGHGTHVAGIIAGSGFDSDGARRGIAPGAHLIVLKALDERGDGFISSAIAAIDYAIEQRAAYNIRVINLSVAAGVYESYKTDPLTLATRRAVDAGIVVVTAAGNLGLSAKGKAQFSGITSPGNAPWVLTVGAASHNGTADRRDDTLAPFSSLGPSAIDQVAKPDLVAPGVGIESLADAGSTLFATRPAARLWGTVPTATQPYLSLSGTSMAAPVVAATVALMLQANPALKPAGVKTILRASAESHEEYAATAQGAGFLDARAAVELARTFVDQPDAVLALDAAVEDDSDLASAPTVCDSADAGCTNYLGACVAGSVCFAQDAGMVVGLTASPADTVVWGAPLDRPGRRRTRGSGKMRKRITKR